MTTGSLCIERGRGMLRSVTLCEEQTLGIGETGRTQGSQGWLPGN